MMYFSNVQIKQRDEQVDSLQQQIMGLERTRDRCVIFCLTFNRPASSHL